MKNTTRGESPLSATFCSRSSDTPETDGVSWTTIGVARLDVVPVGVSVVDADFARRLERERDDARAWIGKAAPVLSRAACIVIDEAGVRLHEIAGVRAILETCPVDFIPENVESIHPESKPTDHE